MAKAPQRAINPNSPIIGNVLPVAGSVVAAGVLATCVSARAGGGVTTSTSCTSSPVGLIAMIGAWRSCIRTGGSASLAGSVTSTGISTAAKRIGVLVILASSIALAFG